MTESIEDRVRRGFYKQGLMQTIGAELLEAAPGRCALRLPYSPAVTQQHGLFNGGIIATMADNAAGFASYALMPADRQPLTVEFKVNFLAAATGGDLITRAEVLRHGRSIFHVRSDAFIAADDDEETLVATVLATIKSTKAVAEMD